MRRRKKREVKVPQFKNIEHVEIKMDSACNQVDLEIKFWGTKDTVKFNRVISEVIEMMMS